MSEYNTKGDRRAKKRNSLEKKWIKHGFGENWGKKHGQNISKELKKVLNKKKKNNTK